MGFSAGGHLASTIATHLTGEELPAFQVLFYPVISMDSRYTHAGSRQNLLGDNPSAELVNLYSNDLQVTSETPVAYLCWADDDTTVKPINSTKYRTALRKVGVSVTSKNFSSGGHGFGFNTSFAYHNMMLKSLTTWLQGLDDIIVGIKEIKNEELRMENEDAIYDLNGRKISAEANSSFFTLHSSLKKGIYIMHNKKILVK